MTEDPATWPEYDPDIVEQTIFLEVIEQHPTRLTVDELALRIVSDPNDGCEIETAVNAVRDLRRACLVRYRNDEGLVELTQVALRAHELLTAI